MVADELIILQDNCFHFLYYRKKLHQQFYKHGNKLKLVTFLS